ncbi:MAG: fibronectin type III domain-containing protein [Treponema sp.]|jgi:fibronectin type 3 domain-containing protein|nr:fibronectin type III domain-containing protein [Treponema sp.]
MSVNKKNNKKLGAPFLAALEAAVLAAVLCAGLSAFTGCKDLFHPEGSDEEDTYNDPSAPYDVRAMANSSSIITVEWSALEPNASSYNIYRATSGSGSYSYIGNKAALFPLVSVTSPLVSVIYTNGLTDTGLSSSTTYYYKVSAYTSSGEGPMSSSYGYATTLDSSGPPAPSNVYASANSSSSITVSWSSVSEAMSYNIYRAIRGPGSYSLIAYSISSTSFTDTGLAPSTTYYYKVSANRPEEGSISSSYAYATTATSSSVSLSNNTWYSATLDSGEVHRIRRSQLSYLLGRL